MLSASHLFTHDNSVFDYTFRAPDGTPCKGDRQIRHPLFNGNNDDTTDYDVVLIRIREPMNGGGPAPLLYGGTREQGAPVVMVGYGARGIRSIGQNDPYDGPSGAKAAATNVVHETMDLVQPPPRTGDRGNWLSVKLRRETEGAGRLDGLLASGDSGGSLWMQTPAGWAVVGVNANGGDQYDDYSFSPGCPACAPGSPRTCRSCGSGGEGALGARACSEKVRHLLDSLDGSYLACEHRMADARPLDPICFRHDRIAVYLTSPAAAVGNTTASW